MGFCGTFSGDRKDKLYIWKEISISVSSLVHTDSDFITPHYWLFEKLLNIWLQMRFLVKITSFNCDNKGIYYTKCISLYYFISWLMNYLLLTNKYQCKKLNSEWQEFSLPNIINTFKLIHIHRYSQIANFGMFIYTLNMCAYNMDVLTACKT